jgi:hypothetical protein
MKTLIRQLARIDFSDRLIPTESQGQRLNKAIVSLIMGTVRVTAMQAAEKLDFGTLESLQLMGEGQAMTLDYTAGASHFILFGRVSRWMDLHTGPEAAPQDGCYPLLPTIGEIQRLLEVTPGVLSCSFQRLASGNWEHHTFDSSLKILKLEAAAMLLLQVDVLCREQKYPRGRLRMHTSAGDVWFWVSPMEKLMMILTDRSAPAASIALSLNCGEAFQLL